MFPEDIVGNHTTSLTGMEQIFRQIDEENLEYDTVYHVAGNINSINGKQVPSTRDSLKAIGVEDGVAQLLMMHVFGSTELVISLNARKILTALDLFDWEETGAKSKMECKMVNVQAERARKSTMTWIPKGDAILFHDVMDSLGSLLGPDTRGVWGKVTEVIKKHFAFNDKKDLEEWALEIIRFYKVARSGGRKKFY